MWMVVVVASSASSLRVFVVMVIIVIGDVGFSSGLVVVASVDGIQRTQGVLLADGTMA